MLSTIKEATNGINEDDVTFLIEADDSNTITYYSCISSLFADRSSIFNKLIKKYKKKQQKDEALEIHLKYMTLNAFCFIRNSFYDLNPTLTYQDVIDILYSSIKYSIKPIIKECNSFLLEIDNLDDFWIVMRSFSCHSKVLFENFFMRFVIKSQFFMNRMDEIIKDRRCLTHLSIFQVQIICRYILSEKLMNDQICYEMITAWCRWHFTNKIKPLLLIKNNHKHHGEISSIDSRDQDILQREFDSAFNTSSINIDSTPSVDNDDDFKINDNNHSSHMINKWQDLFDDFYSLIDFARMDLEFLLTQIRSDHIMTQQDLLSILLQKYEFDKSNDNHYQYKTERKSTTKPKHRQKLLKRKTIGSTTTINNNNNNIDPRLMQRRVSNSSNLSGISNLSGLSALSAGSYKSNTNQDPQTLTTVDLHLNKDELRQLDVGTYLDVRDGFGRYLKAEIIQLDDMDNNRLKIHFNGWSKMWDKWIDIGDSNECQCITRYGSITDREIKKQQLKDLVIGDKVIIKLPSHHKHHGVGWINAEIINMDKGQLNVQYKLNDNDDDSENDLHEYWVHADNINECR